MGAFGACYGSWALDPLNAFAVAGPVVSAHDAAGAQMEEGHGELYALVWGEPVLPERSTAVWLTRPRGIEWRPVLEALRRQLPQTTLWRRQMVLGPGAFCVGTAGRYTYCKWPDCHRS